LRFGGHAAKKLNGGADKIEQVLHKGGFDSTALF
jgi:hypothetical protein